MGKSRSTATQRDTFFRAAKEDGYRARSAYKLLQLHTHFPELVLNPEHVKRAVDLCAAPGSWSQVLANNLASDAKIVAVDLQPMAPLDNVVQLQGDITFPSTAKHTISLLEGQKAELVVCDGAPDVTGVHDLDEFFQAQLLRSALAITLCILKSLPETATFITKMFLTPNAQLLFDQFRCVFKSVQCLKPGSSREGSRENFLIGIGMRKGIWEDGVCDMKQESIDDGDELQTKIIAPFLDCGDLSGYDDPDVQKLLDDLFI